MKAIIFDFDGVIQDTFELIYQAFNQALGPHTRSELKRKVFEKNSREYVSTFEDNKVNDFEAAFAKEFKKLKLDPLIKKILLELAGKYTLFINSSNTEENLHFYFNKNNVESIFEKIYGVETSPSKLKKFELILSENNLSIDDVIFVTDTLGDIKEANKMKIKTIAVDYGFHSREILEKGKPFKIISNLNELL